VLDSGKISSSVQEAARSLMSISSAVCSTQAQAVCSHGTSERAASTRASGLKPDLPSSHTRIGAGLNAVVVVPRDTPCPPAPGRAVSLFGPDIRRLPNPNISALRGHSGSHVLGASSLTSANQLVAGDGATVKVGLIR
jgi:hypothetical protein